MNTHHQSAYKDDHRVFHIYDGENHWVVATSLNEALAAHGVESLGYKSVDEYRADMGPIKVRPLYPHEKIQVSDETGTTVERKAWQWAIDHRGVLCSTCW